MRRSYARGTHDEDESECVTVRGYRPEIETICLGASQKCKPGDNGLDMVGESKKRSDPGTDDNRQWKREVLMHLP